MNLLKLSEHYLKRGYCLLPSFIEVDPNWLSSILSNQLTRNVFIPEPKSKLKKGKGSLKYSIIDRFETESSVPCLKRIYSNLVPILTEITKSDVIESPYHRSAFYCKTYNHGDEQGWHYDSNAISVIIYLTNNETGYTELEPFDSSNLEKIQPKSGSILLMQGRECWHRASAVVNETKVICVMNYYISVAEPRNNKLDGIIFGD